MRVNRSIGHSKGRHSLTYAPDRVFWVLDHVLCFQFSIVLA